MTYRPTAHPRPVRSFVRREGRITPAQQRALEALLARYAVPASTGQLEPERLFGRRAPLCVEIGCGTGTVLAALAARNPGNDYIGIEVYRPGLGQLLNTVERLGLGNVRVTSNDAVEVLAERLPPRSLEQLHVYFPDPWPKKRHHKRRLLNAPFLQLAAGRLAGHGRLFIATDWQDYADGIELAFAQVPGLALLARDLRPAWRPVSRFEARASREGRPVREFMLAPA
jgi:tRNA (guanine-N7-)-methyltransferase